MENIAALARQYARENDYIAYSQLSDLQEESLVGFNPVCNWIYIDEELPTYYKPVNIIYECIEYGFSTTYNNVTTAWLAVNDDGDYIWTINGTDVILPDDVVIKWKYVTIE